MPDRTVHRLHILGWSLFIVSALLFMAAAWHSGDMIAFWAAAAFLAGCIAFLVPLLRRSG